MRGSGVTAARSCHQPLVSVSRYLAIHALPGDPLYFIVEAKSRVKEVYTQTCTILSRQGMRDCELFGLAILSDGEYLFVDPENKLSKYAPKNWRNSHTHGLDSSGRPAFVLYFRVRFYVDTPLLLSDETTRHHYYLQLRDNVVRHGGGVESLHSHHPLHEPSIITPLLVLAGLALQADLGDYSEERHRPHAGSVGYCKPTDYLPPHMCLESNVLAVLAAQHRENSGLSREEAELQYIREAVLLEAPLNAHLYRLRRSKNEAGPGRILLAICARGVRIYAEAETPRVFAWNNIGKLSFDVSVKKHMSSSKLLLFRQRKKFEIRAVDQSEKFTLYSGCDDKSKLLLGLCRDTHQFSMAIAPRVNEAIKREEEERKVLRDCYMYPTRCKLSLTTRGARGDQRISVISSTSSNTTSGIVSDRVHSEDEPDTAPASTECLPRLTETVPYSDGQNRVLNGTNGDTDNHSMPPSSVSIIDEIDSSDATSTSVVLRLASSAATAAEGSQCSSSCSTVVVVNTSTGGTSRIRRTSATSSLELGYSHTAQNSAISSETASFPGAIYDRCKKTGKYTGTDIASETSGVYTLRSSEIQDERLGDDMYLPTGDTNESSAASDVCALSSVQSTTDEASITSGFYTIHSGLRSESSDVYTEDVGAEDQEPIYSLCKGDDDGISLNRQLEDSRSRSNSILSVSSFRGDGSDPSSVRPLLSADELSDLIVGRYPPRKTISTSMDSDCDYVTMPPPPPPPPRTDSDRQVPPPPYPIESIDYATINVSKRSSIPELAREREPPPPPPPYNTTCGDFVPLPPRRTDPPPPPPPYTSSRERIQIPPPTPPRNDAVTPREPPPPPPPYPDISSAIGSVARVAKTTNDGNVAPKPPPRIQPPTYPGDKMKPTPVHAPVAALVVGPNNYLDVHASRGPVLLPYLTTPPPPPPLPPPPTIHPRQPPPPPPPPPSSSSSSSSLPPTSQQPASSLATVYTSQVSRSQIEQYKQQLYSDVDYVMFPLKDPAVSKQEYIDAKQGSLLAAMAAYPPPPYPSFNKSSVMYRSTPYLPGSSFSSQSKYASNQNLSSSDVGSCSGNYLQGNLNSHYAASTSSLYSGATCSSTGSHSLRKEPPVLTYPHTLDGFSRTRSDENILKCLDTLIANKMQSLPQSKHRRLPPPPPPPPYEIQNLEKNQPLPSSSLATSSSLAATSTSKHKKLSNGIEENDEGKGDNMLDIRTLREKSRNLDLPLISALCNDQYLLKQTKAFVLPKHPSEITSTAASTKSGTRSSNGATSSRNKYPVSGLSTTQIQKPLRKSSTSTHKHPSEAKSNAYKVNASSAGVSTIKKDFTRASHS